MMGKGAPRLIDRIDELDHLRHWLAEAIGGSPRIIVLVGEAGIGKSRLVGELLAEARAANVRPFAGRCQEGARVPLLPFASVLDTLLPRRDVAVTHHVSDDVDVAVSLVGEIGRALLAAAADRPVIAVVEDMQWADEATIQLLGHLAATLAHEALFRQLPVALLTTARPTRVAPEVQQLLSRLTHETIGRSLYLRSLDDLHVFELIEARTGGRPSVELLRLVNEIADGNPLEIENLVTRLEHASALARRGRDIVPTIDDVARLPARTVFAGSFEQLPDDVRELLVTLALLRDGRLGLVRAATGLPAERFEEALEYATTTARVLVEDATTVDFVDKTFAEAVSATMGTGKRRRYHGEIASRLAAVMPGEGVTASDVVGQLHRAGERADAALLASLARDAGDEAFAVSAYGDALRHYGAALASPALDDTMRAALHERAAVAAYRNLDRTGAAAHAARAVELARGNDDLATWGEAALLEARVAHQKAPLEAFLQGVGDAEPALRARAHSVLSELEFDRLELDAAARNVEAAQRLAQQVEDPATTARVEFGAGLQRFGALDLDRAETHFRRAEEFATAASDELVAGWARNRRPLVAWSRGDLDEAATLAATAASVARANGWWAEYALVASVRAGIALALGNLSATERLGAEAATAHRRSEQVAVSGILWSAMASARTLLGDAAGAYAALDEWAQDDPRPRPLYAALVRASTGVEDPRSDAAAWTPSPLVGRGRPLDIPLLSMACLATELADALGRPDIAVNALDVLLRAHDCGVRFTPGWNFFVTRLAGVAHLLAGHRDDAVAWLERAHAEAGQAHAIGELARSTYDRARVDLDGVAIDARSAALDPVIAEFDRLGFQPLSRAARRLAGRPEITPSSVHPATRVILVTDLVDSTPLARRVGDERFVELLREHNRIVRARVRQFDGVEFKHTGDGIAAWFLTAASALDCALRICHDIELSNERRPRDPLAIRIGLSAGEVVADGSDVFGLAVITAFRVVDRAPAGRIAVSPNIPELVPASAFRFAPIGDVVLKGFAEPMPIFAVAAPS